MSVAADGANDEDLAKIQSALSKKPYDHAKHLEHVRIAKLTKSKEALEQARESLASYFALSADEWLEWIHDAAALPPTTDNIVAVLLLYQRAEKDVLSIDVCHQHALYALASYYECRGLAVPSQDGEEEMGDATKVNEELQMIWTIDFTREQLQAASERAGQHLLLGYRVWDLWLAFEQNVLPDHPSLEQKESVYNLFILRLSEPHYRIEETFATFSTFITTQYGDLAYEEKMVEVNGIYAPSKDAFQRREIKEDELQKAQYSTDAYLAYIAYERTGKKALTADPAIVRNLLERAISDHPQDWHIWDAYLQFYKDQLATASEDSDDEDTLDGLLETAEKAVRCLPSLSDSWIALMRAQERKDDLEQVEETFSRGWNSGLMYKSLEDAVKMYMARADFHRRLFEQLVESGSEETPHFLIDVLQVVNEGAAAVKKASKTGDPAFRLQRYLTRFLERFGRLDEGIEVWQKACDMFKYQPMAWMGFAELHIRRNDVAAARQTYLQAVKNRFEYPEYLFDAWTTFEHQHGSLQQIDDAEAEVKKQMRNINSRRARLAAEAALQQPSANGLAQSNGSEERTSVKRQADEDQEAAGSGRKRAKVSHANSNVAAAPEAPTSALATTQNQASTSKLKRDRENATVLVGGFPPNATEEDLTQTFKDCGIIREVVLFVRPDQTYATVEFMERESVPAALTKDKKRIQGAEIAVETAWESTLYVHNFPESVTMDGLKQLFSPYGTILDVRLPSKRFKATRRFAYISFANSAAARSCLALNGKELDGGLQLSVEISDPSRKKERTDAHANQKEIYVAGLAKSVTEQDLRKLFAQFGAISGIRVAMDDTQSACRGFAFIDFESEEGAQAALALNSTEFKKRNLSVAIADSRQAGTKARSKQTDSTTARENARERSIRISNLPADTQEASIDEAISQHEKVVKVIVNAERNSATIELESVASAGRILLLPEGSITLQGTPLSVAALNTAVPIAQRTEESTTSMKPRVFNNRGRGRGTSARGRGGFAKR